MASLALVALAGLVAAMPAPDYPHVTFAPRAAAATDLWVSVDSSGTPHTITPSVTTIDGTASVINPVPEDVTATVVTGYNNGDRTIATNTAPIATATSSSGAGSFAVCNNTDGEYAPFCTVAGGQPLTPGNTYYITWDSTVFASNTTIQVTGDYLNDTSGDITTQAFSSDPMAAAWSFYAWTVPSSVIPSGNNVTIQLSLMTLGRNSSSSERRKGPKIMIKAAEKYKGPDPQIPGGPALYIGLPVIVGFIALIGLGTCWWNKNVRKIDIKGSVMGSRGKGYGAGKSFRSRMGLKKNGANIPLMDRLGNDNVNGDARYHDDPDFGAPAPRPRRDSEDLASLAGTPKQDRFSFHMGPGAGRNAFRDEIARQNRDRHME